MDTFKKARVVRLKSAHGKYLTADEDEETVTQDRNGSSRAAKWTVEFVDHSDSLIRLKSCYGKYLTASNQPFLLGMTGLKVIQTLPRRLDSSLEWEPIKDNAAVKLKTRHGQFLRANGGTPPWRNSVTHSIPHRTSSQEWILWDVHVMEILVVNQGTSPPPQPKPIVRTEESVHFDTGSASSKYSSFSRQESNDSYVDSPPRGRQINFIIADENGEVEEGCQEMSISFNGSEVSELTKRLEMEVGAVGITVCTKSPLNGKLYPLRLQLPPNNATMHVVVLPPHSKRMLAIGGALDTGNIVTRIRV